MKIIMSLFILFFSTNVVVAATTLKAFDSISLQGQIAKSASAEGITNVDIFKGQSFSINENDKTIGFLIPAKVKLKEMQSVCLIGWSLDGKNLASILPTVGFGDWQSVTCAGVNAVGVVSKKDDKNIKIGIIYHTMTRFNDSPDYFILNVDQENKTLVYDSITTSKLENSEAKNISEMRRDLQK